MRKDTDYAAPYHKIKGAGVIDYQLPHSAENEEIPCPADDLTLRGGIARWGAGLCAMTVTDSDTYATLKARLVKIRYSLDDQMAVILNADEAEIADMQAWREWAADIAARIISAPRPPEGGAAKQTDY